MALRLWLLRLLDFFATKRGLGAALYTPPLGAAIHEFFDANVAPALQRLLDAATRAGEAPAGIRTMDVFLTVSAVSATGDAGLTERTIDLLLAGEQARSR